MDELLGDFLTETKESLQTVDNQIVTFERDPSNREVLNDIFRLVHTIKGTCGFLNLPRLERLAHAAETVLGKVRDGHVTVNSIIVNETLAAIDAIKVILESLEATGKEPEGDDEALIDRLGGTILADKAAVAPVSTDKTVTSDPVGFTAGKSGESIRVSVTLLEQLMTNVSELVLTRNELQQLMRGVQNDQLTAPLQRLSSQIGEIQESVMRTRMQPISNAWSSLPRLVRSLSGELGKPLELLTEGGDTELDRQLLELIKDPLSHMVRNAADHGIEDAETRKAAGKSNVGRITLRAGQEGGYIIIRLEDDGGGINTERLAEKALSLGLLSQSDMQDVSQQQLQRLIFHAGLSTAEEVTSISGRGVGMDVVNANIEKIGGTIEVESTPGVGCRFTVRIPLTLAIMPALIVASCNQRFAMPQMAVLELVRAGDNNEHKIEYVNAAPVLRLRGRLLPLVHLGELLGIDNGEGKGDYILVSRVGQLTFGIVVDAIYDTEEIVVKPVAPILKALSVYSGNAILGDGQVIMILDANGIAEKIAGAIDVEHQGNAPVEDHVLVRDTDAMLLFRASSEHPKAVPLSLVTRLEEIDVSIVEWSDGQPVIQYREGLVPLVPVDGNAELRSEGRQPVLVFSDGANTIGLIVDEILDIVETSVDIRMSSDQPSRLGTAIIAGKATEILDVAYYLKLVGKSTKAKEMVSAQDKGKPRTAVLIVDDSAFFRNMLKPLLGAAGYKVTTASSADEALSLREQGEYFDLILSDIEMPGLSGVDFAREVRSDGRWSLTPLVALSSLTADEHVRRGEEAGFDQYVPKFDRGELLDAVARQLRGEAA